MNTALQKHLAYFDHQHTDSLLTGTIDDGIVTISESRKGLRALGLGMLKAEAIATPSHLVLGPLTSHKLTRRIDISHAALGKHPSDTDIFDDQGNLDEARFNALFSRFDDNRSGTLSKSEITRMVKSLREPGIRGFISSRASQGEFNVLLAIAGDASETTSEGKREPAIARSTLMAFYSGDLLQRIADARANK